MIVLVDLNNLLYAAFHKNYNEMTQQGFLLTDVIEACNLYVLDKLRQLAQDLRVTKKRMIICVDSKESWRQDEYMYYKAKRKESKKDLDTDTLYKFFSDIENILRREYVYVKVDRCEGDDIIGVLSTLPSKVIIVSRDKDMLQLKNDTVTVYDPSKNQFTNTYTVKSGETVYTVPAMNKEDSKYILELMIIRGDDSDGVPNILSDDDVFVNPTKKQKNCGYKKIINEILPNEREKEKIFHENKDNYKRNKKMIDLREIPEHIKQSIIDEYERQIKMER